MNRCALSRVEEHPETQRGLRCSPVRQLRRSGSSSAPGMGVHHRHWAQGHSTIALLQMDSTVTNVVRYVTARPGPPARERVIVQE